MILNKRELLNDKHLNLEEDLPIHTESASVSESDLTIHHLYKSLGCRIQYPTSIYTSIVFTVYI